MKLKLILASLFLVRMTIFSCEENEITNNPIQFHNVLAFVVNAARLAINEEPINKKKIEIIKKTICHAVSNSQSIKSFIDDFMLDPKDKTLLHDDLNFDDSIHVINMYKIIRTENIKNATTVKKWSIGGMVASIILPIATCFSKTILPRIIHRHNFINNTKIISPSSACTFIFAPLAFYLMYKFYKHSSEIISLNKKHVDNYDAIIERLNDFKNLDFVD